MPSPAPEPEVSFADIPPAKAEKRAGGNGASQPAAAPSWSGTSAVAPTWHGGDGDRADRSELRIGHERLELARAYLDLGDNDTARGLLQEIVQVGDPDARAEAVRLLQDLPR